MTNSAWQESVPQPDSVLEVSRRIKSRQRDHFKYLVPLHELAINNRFRIHSSPSEVRVNLISRYDNLNPSDSKLTTGLGSFALTKLIEIESVSTCNEYSSLTLGAPVLCRKSDKWHTIEMPIEGSDYSFGEERVALTNKIDEVLDEVGSIWLPETPVLQVVEFKADDEIAALVLDYVTAGAPNATEVFDASLRFRYPA